MHFVKTYLNQYADTKNFMGKLHIVTVGNICEILTYDRLCKDFTNIANCKWESS